VLALVLLVRLPTAHADQRGRYADEGLAVSRNLAQANGAASKCKARKARAAPARSGFPRAERRERDMERNIDSSTREGIPLDRPNVARMYDWLLGGSHNFEGDRLAAEAVLQVYPEMRQAAWVNRAFMRRAVLFLIEQGINQFLDIGSGLPTVGNVHEVAQGAEPAPRVVYVDVDPVAVTHSRAMLTDNPNATAIRADVHHPDEILNHLEVTKLLDFHQPLGLLLTGLLHLVPADDQAYSSVYTLRDALAPGSYVVISHGTTENAPPDLLEQLDKLSATISTPYRYRSTAEVQSFFDGLELVEPGLVPSPLWRPEGPEDILFDRPERSLAMAGVGRKP